MGIFKHLIHIFMFIFIISFAGMLYVVSDENTDDIGITDTNTIDQAKILEEFINSHPMYYGISS